MFEEYSDNGFVCQCKTHGFLCVHKNRFPSNMLYIKSISKGSSQK